MRITIAVLAVALLSGCSASPPVAPQVSAPAMVPVEGGTYMLRHESWPAGQEVPVVFRDGRYQAL